MLGYELQDLNDMTYGIDSALLMINQDENPANGLWAEGYFD
jgi:hypothetical protein